MNDNLYIASWIYMHRMRHLADERTPSDINNNVVTARQSIAISCWIALKVQTRNAAINHDNFARLVLAMEPTGLKIHNLSLSIDASAKLNTIATYEILVL